MSEMLKPNPKRIARGMWWDEALSLVEGCSPVDESCQLCWSANQAYIRSHQKNPIVRKRYEGLNSGSWTFNGQIKLMEKDLQKPIGKKPRVYAVWNDLFHPKVPDSFIDRFMDLAVHQAPQHLYMVLTKRPRRMMAYSLQREIPPNVWPGVTVPNQNQVERILWLKRTHVAEGSRRFVSYEPALGPVNFYPYVCSWTFPDHYSAQGGRKITFSDVPALDMIIGGGQTGPDATPALLSWFRQVRDDCRAAGTAFLFKQWGEYCPPSQMPDDTVQRVDAAHNLGSYNDDPWPVGKRLAGRQLDGMEHNGWPK